MIHLTAQTRIRLAVTPADFRKGIDGLAALVKYDYTADPRSAVFVFINRRATMIRILAHENNGFWMMTKRISSGKFSGWPRGEQPLCPIQSIALRQLLNGPASE